MKILVVEDSRLSATKLKAALDQLGHEVVFTTNGLEGWEAIQNDTFSIVITDWEMPEMDGINLTEHIRTLELQLYPYIIMLTSKGSRDDRLTALHAGASDFLSKPFDPEELHARIAVAERMLAVQKQLAESNSALLRENADRRVAEQKLQAIFNTAPDAIILCRPDGRIFAHNITSDRLFGGEQRQLDDCNVQELLVPAQTSSESVIHPTLSTTREMTAFGPNNKRFPMEITSAEVHVADEKFIVIIGRDISERRAMEFQLHQAQKLESVGQLAAGIAHEINTPIQYVRDNTVFIKEEFAGLANLVSEYRHYLESENGHAQQARERIAQVSATLDIDFLLAEIPSALAQTLEGAESVARIVRSIKDFSHPGGEEKTSVDINAALESTITVCRNEWKYVANVELALDPSIPLIPAYPGELNQVFLNVIVNAAHAIGDVTREGKLGKGTISIRTKLTDQVEIEIQDTGGGIPDSICTRIFDPFFTTKDVGKGTGQGLAIAHTTVVERHGGTIDFSSVPNVGTTFHIRLPLESTVRTSEELSRSECQSEQSEV